MKKSLLIACILMNYAICFGQHSSGTSTHTKFVPTDSVKIKMAAGKQFTASGWKMLWWGEHYRKEWATPVEFSVIRIDTIKGGLTPIKQGGGHQTKTLRLMGGDDKEYVLRTIDKSLDMLVPPEFKNTVINDLVNDQISTAHPYGPLAISALANQLSLMHTNPIIIYVPDDPALGEYKDIFANKLCLLEERPSGKGWEHTNITKDADDVVNTEKLLEKVLSDTKHKVDQYEYLKVRLFDILVNDWDRHEDQWVWAAYKNEKRTNYVAFGRDRDQAFSKTDGITVYMLSRPWALRSLQNMDSRVRDVKGSAMIGRFTDRQFLNELSKEQWRQAISFIQKNLTDSSIVDAINKMPAEVNKISGDFLIERLKQRRDNMESYGMEYYDVRAKEVYINGSNKHEEFHINNINENELTVTGIGPDNDTFYFRKFDRSETKEINIYGLDGNDKFVVSGNGPNKFVVRAIGGNGNNEYVSLKENNPGKQVSLYDTVLTVDIPQKYFKLHTSNHPTQYQFNRTDYKYDWYIPVITPGANPDDGFYLGLGLIYRKQQWGKTPFGWQQKLVLDYAFGTGAFGVSYKGVFKQRIGKLDLDIDASYKGPRYVLNYYGLGNDTEIGNNSKTYYRVRAKIMNVNPGISFSRSNSYFKTGLIYQRVNVIRDDTKYISTPPAEIDSSVYGNKYFGGLDARWDYTTARATTYPTKGFLAAAGFSALHNFSVTSNNLLNVYVNAGFYYTILKRITLAHRSGYAHNIGQFEFYQANKIGGWDNLRGFWRDRFAGRSSFYQNTDLRINITTLKGYVFRGQFGVVGFVDDGRVWISDEESSTFHVGYGGGIYFIPYRALSLNLYYATSSETNMVVLKTGFIF